MLLNVVKILHEREMMSNMLLVETKALVTQICTLTEEDEQKVREYKIKNSTSFDDAIKQLWDKKEIHIYTNKPTDSKYDVLIIKYSDIN